MENKYFTAIKYLSVFGLLLSVYLIWQQLARPAFQPCNINSWINCEAIVSGSVAKTLGIPTPLYGFIGYLVIFLATFRRNKKLILGMAAFGLVFCLYIAFVELYLLRVVCPVCIGCQITMISVFTLAILLNRNHSSGKP